MLSRTMILGFFLLAFWAGPYSVQASELLAHRAEYELSLVQAKSGAGISRVSGGLIIEMRGSSCEGWTVRYKYTTLSQLQDGSEISSKIETTSWEAADGNSYQFIEKFVNSDNSLLQERVTVKRGKETEMAVGKVLLPEEASFTLPAGVLFPIRHTQHILNQARLGKQHDSSFVYDGDEAKQASQVVTAIGQEAQDEGLSVTFPQLRGHRFWPLTSSYYKPTSETPDQPDFEINLHQFDNGIATDLIINYGDFSLKGELKKIDTLPQAGCP